jgi:AcrR family transcriptional regulator
MEQIAERAGVSKATLYDNFDGKAGLTTALLERYGAGLIGTFAAAVQQRATAREVVTTGLEIFVRLIAADPEIYRFIVRHADGPQLIDEIAAPIAALVDQAGGREPDAVAMTILGATFTASEWWSRSGTCSSDALLRTLTDFVWGGLQASGIDASDRPVDLDVLVQALGRPRPCP